DHRPEQVDPLIVRVYLEALRLLRRAPHAEAILAGEASEQEAFGWQVSRLAALEPALVDYLEEVPAELCTRLPRAPADAQRDLLRALRGHPSPQTEAFLLLAARDWDPTCRIVAIGSLGWWEPLQRYDVLLTLQDARRDPNPDVRQAARAALARLGERQALQW